MNAQVAQVAQVAIQSQSKPQRNRYSVRSDVSTRRQETVRNM